MIVVLLPGMDGTGRLFKPFVDSLPAGAQVVIVTYPPDVALRYHELERTVRAQLPVGEPYIIIAESYSGPIALSLAADPVGDLRAVVLTASFPARPLGSLGKWWLTRLPLAVLFHFRAPRAILRWVLLDDSASNDLLTQVEAAIAAIRPEVLAARVREALLVDRMRELSRCKVRLVWLIPENDRLLRCADLRRIRRVHATSEFVTLPGPHLLLQCAPDIAATALTRLGLLDN